MDQVKSQFLAQFLMSNVHFVRKGCDGHLKLNRNFTAVFDVQRPFRAKGKGCDRLSKIAILFSF